MGIPASNATLSDEQLNRDVTFISRVAISGYRSIDRCDVRLGPLTFLVGPNGAGKSNFIDALRFIADALHVTLDHAVRSRGGITEVVQRNHLPQTFTIRVEFRLPINRAGGTHGHFAVRVHGRDDGGYAIVDEECIIHDGTERIAAYRTHDGQTFDHQQRRFVDPAMTGSPPVEPDRLYLVTVSGLPPFRPAYDALSQMGFYNLDLDALRDLQQPSAGGPLTRDGSNLASVLGGIAEHDPEAKERIEAYLRLIVPELRSIARLNLGPRDTVEFGMDANGASEPSRFMAASMSDGTLRALGVLVALYQRAAEPATQKKMRFVAIEEPELSLHPAAAGVLLGSLRDASRDVQVLVSSHSPDLLDDDEIDSDSILAVVMDHGVTRIGPLDTVSRSVLHDRLFTSGELLRLDQLRPSEDSVTAADQTLPDLFDVPSE
jgi:predicted ATPase